MSSKVIQIIIVLLNASAQIFAVISMWYANKAQRLADKARRK